MSLQSLLMVSVIKPPLQGDLHHDRNGVCLPQNPLNQQKDDR